MQAYSWQIVFSYCICFAIFFKEIFAGFRILAWQLFSLALKNIHFSFPQAPLVYVEKIVPSFSIVSVIVDSMCVYVYVLSIPVALGFFCFSDVSSFYYMSKHHHLFLFIFLGAWIIFWIFNNVFNTLGEMCFGGKFWALLSSYITSNSMFSSWVSNHIYDRIFLWLIFYIYIHILFLSHIW